MIIKLWYNIGQSPKLPHNLPPVPIISHLRCMHESTQVQEGRSIQIHVASHSYLQQFKYVPSAHSHACRYGTITFDVVVTCIVNL